MRLFDKYPSGAFGPEPGYVVPDDDAEALIERTAKELIGDPRKSKAWDRWSIYNENYRQLVVDRIGEIQNDTETKRELSKFVNLTLNPALDITRAVSVCYKQGVRRTVDGATDPQLEAFHRVIQESRLDVLAPQWNRQAFLLGPVIVVPVIRNNRLRYDTLLPHFTDVVVDTADPGGPPRAAAWSVRGDPSALGAHNVVDTVLLDGASWRYYSTSGGKPKLIREVEHGVGYFPGAVFRLDDPFDSDWWSIGNERLVGGTIEVGVISAALQFVRKAQCKKLLVMVGNLTETGNKLDPEIPLTISTGPQGPSALSIDSIDFDTPPDSFIKHIRWIYASLAESYGIPSHTVDFDQSSGTEGERLAQTHAGLTELRNEQIPFARNFEHTLMASAVRMMRSKGHPLASRMPTPEQVDEAFRVEFPKLSRHFADPRTEMEFTDWEIRKGRISVVDVLRRENPTLTDAQIWTLLENNLERQSKFNDEVTKRNLGMGPSDDVETAAQAFGRMGPKMRDQPKENK